MKFGAFLVVGFALIKICACGPSLYEPQNLTATDIQSRNLTISWQKPVNHDDQTISYTVFYKESNNAKCWEELTDVKDTKATLVSLKPYRRYHIFVMAKANGTYGIPTPRYNVTTEEAAGICPDQSGCECEKNTLTWQPVPKEDRNGIILGYTIFYRDSSMPNGTYHKVNTTNETTPDGELNTYYEFKNLTCGSGYSFKVASYNSKGYCKGYEKLPMFKDPKIPKTTSSPTPSPTLSLSTQTTSVTITMSSLPKVSTMQQLPTSRVSITASTTALSTPKVTSTQKVTTPTPEVTTPTPEVTTPETTQQTCPPLTQKPCICPPSTQEPTGKDTEKPAEKLSGTKTNDWLKYVAIALAVIVVIMGITIFLLIWQLYKNHRSFKLRQNEAYKMKTQDQMGQENQAQDNP